MEIENIGFSTQGLPELSEGKREASSDVPSEESAALQPSSDTISLTELSRTIQEVLASKDEPDPEREDFVREIAEKVQAGTYEVKVDDLVTGLLGGF